MTNMHKIRIEDRIFRKTTTTGRVYTHAVAIRGEKATHPKGSWWIVSWCGSEDLARQKAAYWTKRDTRARVLENGNAYAILDGDLTLAIDFGNLPPI